MLKLPIIPIQDVIEARDRLLALTSRLAQKSFFGMAMASIEGYPHGFWIRTGLLGKDQRWHGFSPIFKKLFPESDGLIPGATDAEVYNLVGSVSLGLDDFYAHVEQARIFCELFNHRKLNPDDYHPITCGSWPFESMAEAYAAHAEPKQISELEGLAGLQQREDFSKIAWSYSVLSDSLKTFWGPGQPLYSRPYTYKHDVLIDVPVKPFPMNLSFALPKAARSVSESGTVPSLGAVMRLVLSSLGSMEDFFRQYDSLVETLKR